MTLMALQESVEPKIVEKAVILSLAVDDSFDLNEVLRVQGVKDGLSGNAKLGELVELFTQVDELEAVGKGQSWVGSNSSFIEGAGEWIQSRGWCISEDFHSTLTFRCRAIQRRGHYTQTPSDRAHDALRSQQC